MKRSRFIAVLLVSSMLLSVAQPAFAERSWEQVGEDTAYGGFMGGFAGGLVGALVMGAAVVATGGLAALPLAGAAIGGAAATGATYGAGAGAVVGAVGGKEAVNKYVDDVTQNGSEETVNTYYNYSNSK